ncbi:MAG TPA: aspartate-semialdehyde dehydrogenase [Gammaproteobacteria bacterium]|nr:aspartate-semialdehyde dehydrogenase [Gammaproteobacteria bacterium]
MSTNYDVAVVGATGLVGEVMIQVLEERNFPVGRLFPLASQRSVGRTVKFRDQTIPVHVLEGFNFEQVQLALFSAGGSVSAEFAPRAAAAGAVVIDNSSHFRYEDDIPLVVPEVNPQRIADYTNRGIIANPNCSTIQMVVALKPIHDAVGIERINVATYQAVSGAGRSALERLTEHTRQILAGIDPVVRGNEKWVAFNAVPQIDVFLDTGYTKEEMKMIWETRKIMEDPSIMVNPTAVRVPVYFGHSEAVHIETRTKITVPEVRTLLNSAPGVVVIDGRKLGAYPTAATDAAHQDAVYVGRIREDLSHPRGINLWIVADNVRKGAATNSVQIAEILVNQFM